MNQSQSSVYTHFVGFRTDDRLHDRLQGFSAVLGRRKSDVVRYLLVNCLNAYEGDREAIAKIKQEMY